MREEGDDAEGQGCGWDSVCSSSRRPSQCSCGSQAWVLCSGGELGCAGRRYQHCPTLGLWSIRRAELGCRLPPGRAPSGWEQKEQVWKTILKTRPKTF